MQNPYQTFETNKNYEKDGVWLNYGAWAVKVARAGGKNTKFAKVREEVARKNNIGSLGNADTEVVESLYAEIYAKAIIKDSQVYDEDEDQWKEGLFLKNKETDEVEVVEPSVSNIVQCFNDLPDLFDDIVKKSNQIRTFKQEEDEELIKN